ncbi:MULTISPECIES: hypothetical protein [Fusobacterium]|uniref:hypothetical protein n=1 Tax=Fusobacterium TaxID=848 RepID=UPI001476CE40|nr:MULTISPECIES: hypothetical protein [Fusobacterium]NME36821.1 hypothetical protein [Fusobacterium sp. FSA-380-WT-3A]
MKDLEKIKENIKNQLSKKLGKEIDKNNLILMNEGEYINAAVFRYKDENLDLTIKDFSTSPWILKNTLGRIFVKREGNSLKKLEENPSVTKNIIFLSKYTLAFDFIKGKPLKSFLDNSIEKEFFLELEKNVIEMHKKDIVHLDLRNLGNIIVGENYYPYLIDFQSCISIKWLPQKLKDLIKGADITGIYKCWSRKCKEPLDEERIKYFNDFQKIRKVWIFKGYPLKRLKENLKNKFKK